MSTHESWMVWSLLRGCLHADHLEWGYPSVVWRHSLQEWSSAAPGKDHLSKQFWCRSELPSQVYSMHVLWRGWTASISIDTVIAEGVRRLTQMTPPQSDKVSESLSVQLSSKSHPMPCRLIEGYPSKLQWVRQGTKDTANRRGHLSNSYLDCLGVTSTLVPYLLLLFIVFIFEPPP